MHNYTLTVKRDSGTPCEITLHYEDYAELANGMLVLSQLLRTRNLEQAYREICEWAVENGRASPP